jgi:hypothetical protein
MSDNIYFKALVAKQAYHLFVPVLKKRTMSEPCKTYEADRRDIFGRGTWQSGTSVNNKAS